MPCSRYVSDGLSGAVLDQEALRCRIGRNAYALRPSEGARTRLMGTGIVVPRCVDDGNAVIAESSGLLEQKAFGLEGEAISIEQVATDQKRIHIFADRQVNRPAKGLAGGLAQALANRFRAACERGVEVDVGDVDETHGAK